MLRGTVLCVQRSEAIRFAARYLTDHGITVTDKCDPDVTHVLLPVPSFRNGDEYLAHLLTKLPDELTVSGGNLITAESTITLLEKQLQCDPTKKQVLIIGWGRIGKCLCPLLKEKGAEVTVTARKISDQAMIQALGYDSIPIEEATGETERFHIIINTVPVLLFPQIQTSPDCVIIELASKPGMTGPNIVDGRGLPGKLAPMKSGKLIAETFLRLSV